MSKPLLFVALLLALPAHAMNKCVDANGRVTYQEDPCPGKVVRPAPKPPAPVEAPAAPAAPAPVPAAEAARSPLAEGSIACERVRQKIAEVNETLPAASIEQVVEAQRMVARAKAEYPDCKL